MKHRLYSFINHLYMSPLQWGIQTAHCVSTMSRCKKTALQTLAYNEWADEEPTIIVLQGGNLGSLKRLEDTLFPLAQKLELPFASFREDQESLGGILTAVSVLVPETLFNVTKEESYTGEIFILIASSKEIKQLTFNIAMFKHLIRFNLLKLSSLLD